MEKGTGQDNGNGEKKVNREKGGGAEHVLFQSCRGS